MLKQLLTVFLAVGSLVSAPSRGVAQSNFYETTFSTTATFGCGPVLGITYKTGSCTTDGSSLSILSDGGQTLTVTFLGVSDVPVIATPAGQIVDLGIIQTTLSGLGTFSFREPLFPWWYPFQFGINVGIQTSVPVSGAALWYKSVSPTAVVAEDPTAGAPGFPLNNALPPYSLVFASPTAGGLTAGGSANVTAIVGLFAPEPSTLVLTATGLLLMSGVAFSQRRAKRSSSRRSVL
jgi:hypothetical protein